MDFYDLIKKNRSYRRFYEDQAVELDLLKTLVEYARLSPSARNLQSLRFLLSADRSKNDQIFPCLSWAGYLKDWDGPIAGERPAAYIIILNDSTLSTNYFCDHGIMAQSILLGAVEKGLGGCIIASINKKRLREELQIPDHLEILLALAIGKPKEKVVIEKVDKDGNIKYWRDIRNVHHVPKRNLDDLILKL